jgi:L-amino acid N-acyltransferase YncA
MAVLVRDAAGRDAIECAQIYAPYVTGTAISFEQSPPTPEQIAGRIREFQRDHAWLVAQRDGEVCGYAYGHAFAQRAAYRWSCEVSIYLAADARGHGLGRELYTHLLDRLALLGYRSALAGITQPNEASNGLHQAMGFEQCALYRGVGYKFEAWHDVAWFQLPLGPGTATPPTL